MQKDLLQRGKRRMEKREMGNGGTVRKVAAVCFPAQKQSQSESSPKATHFQPDTHTTNRRTEPKLKVPLMRLTI